MNIRELELLLRATGDLLAVPEPTQEPTALRFANRRPVCDLDHLHLGVRDIDESARFYREWFGLDGDTFAGTLFARNASGFLLCLTPDPEATPVPNAHFGFALANEDAVRRLHDDMRAAGLPLDDDVYSEPGFASFTVRDPDGNVLEVFAE